MIYPVTRSLLPAATLLIERSFGNTAYVEGAVEVLRGAVAAPGSDGIPLAFIASDDAGGDFMVGVIVFGSFGGTNGAGRLHFVAVEDSARRAGVATSLVRTAIESLEQIGARMMLAELPDDPIALPGARAFLEALEFTEESRVENLYREGIAMTFMRRELDRG